MIDIKRRAKLFEKDEGKMDMKKLSDPTLLNFQFPKPNIVAAAKQFVPIQHLAIGIEAVRSPAGCDHHERSPQGDGQQ